MTEDTTEVPTDALKAVVDFFAGDDHHIQDEVEKLAAAMWEPYEPCPVCGNESHFGETVVVHSPVHVSHDGYPEYKDMTFGKSLHISCNSCDTVLHQDSWEP